MTVYKENFTIDKITLKKNLGKLINKIAA